MVHPHFKVCINTMSDMQEVKILVHQHFQDARLFLNNNNIVQYPATESVRKYDTCYSWHNLMRANDKIGYQDSTEKSIKLQNTKLNNAHSLHTDILKTRKQCRNSLHVAHPADYFHDKMHETSTIYMLEP